MASSSEALRAATLSYCSRLRILAEKACAHGEAAGGLAEEVMAVVEGMAEDLRPYEEAFEGEPIPSAHLCKRADRAALYAMFWSAVENYDLQGTSDLTDPILELESRDRAAGGSG